MWHQICPSKKVCHSEKPNPEILDVLFSIATWNAAVFSNWKKVGSICIIKCICVICVYLGMLPTTVWKGSGSQNWEHLLVVCTWELRITKPAYRFSTLGPGFETQKKFWIMGNIPGYWILMMWLTVLQGYQSNQDSFMQAVWFLQLPGTCLSRVLRLQPSKTRSFPIKTGVIWVPARYMTGNGCDPKKLQAVNVKP